MRSFQVIERSRRTFRWERSVSHPGCHHPRVRAHAEM